MKGDYEKRNLIGNDRRREPYPHLVQTDLASQNLKLSTSAEGPDYMCVQYYYKTQGVVNITLLRNVVISPQRLFRNVVFRFLNHVDFCRLDFALIFWDPTTQSKIHIKPMTFKSKSREIMNFPWYPCKTINHLRLAQNQAHNGLTLSPDVLKRPVILIEPLDKPGLRFEFVTKAQTT